jgi:hypothetical protein
VWGLLLVLVLGAFGGLIDAAHTAAGGAQVGPGGLAAGAWATDRRHLAERNAARAASSFLAGTSLATDATAERSLTEWTALVDRAYVERRAELVGDADALRALAQRYRDTRGAIDAARARGPFEAFLADELAAVRRIVAAAIALSPAAVIEGVADALVRVPLFLIAFAPWTVVLGGLPLLVLTAIFGGALSRMAAAEATRGLRPTARETAAWVRLEWVRLALVPILPLALFGTLLLVLVAVGVFLRIPALDLVGGVLYGVGLVAAALIAVLATATAICLPMSLAAVATGDGSADESIVRANSYLLRAPGGTIVALVVGLVAATVATVVVGAAVGATFAIAAWGVGLLGAPAADAVGASGHLAVFLPEAHPISLPVPGVTARAAALLIDLWDGLLLALVAAFAANAIADVCTRAYLYLRYRCDGQDVSTFDGTPLGAD